MIHPYLIAGLIAAGQQPNYPVELILDEARNGCSQALQSDNLGSVQVHGWSALTPEPNSWIARTVSRDWSSQGPVSVNARVLLSKTAAARAIYLVAADQIVDGQTLRTCAVYEPTASMLVDPNRLGAWAGREPMDRPWDNGLLDGHIFHRVWRPGLSAGAEYSRVSYFDAAAFPGLRTSGLSYDTGTAASAKE